MRGLDGELLKCRKELNNLKDQLAKNDRLLEESRQDVQLSKQKLTGMS